MRLFLFAVLIAGIGTRIYGAEIEFDSAELARESVYPVFEDPKSVLNRAVSLKGKTEFGLNAGLSLIEAIYDPVNVGFNLTYHMDETHGINVAGIFFSGGLSQYANQLQQPESDPQGFDFKFEFTPEPTFVVLGNYQFTAYYGKMSLSKESTMNLHLYGLLGAGAISFAGSPKPALSAGLGQKFYFNPRWALRFDLRFMAYNGPNVIKEDLKNLIAEKSADEFPQELTFSSYLTVGLVYLF